MTLTAGISARHVNSYHVNNSLLFQFILSEFIDSFIEIKKLDSLCSNTESHLKNEPVTGKSESANLQEIENALKVLAGSTKEYMRLFSWNFSEGLLMKLKTYCSLMLQNSASSEKDFIAIQHYAEKIWQGCLLATDALREAPFDRPALKSAIEKASTAMHRFAKQIARLMQQFRDDENVIFFIVRHHRVLDTLYGSRFTAKLLSRMFSKGLREVQHFLLCRYAQRGFNNLESPIRSLIAEIEASAV